MKLALLTCCAVACAGCSLAMKRLPTTWQPADPPSCTDNQALPVLDATAGVPLTIAGGAFTTAVLIDCHGAEDDPFDLCGDFTFFGALVTVIGLAFVSSSASGFYAASKCRRARRRHQAWQRSQR